eukprot:m.13291 g.13291  ORF g.13291 m.13291 type:complete len:705 (+) comp4829_c0_seq2:55-2169(+)
MAASWNGCCPTCGLALKNESQLKAHEGGKRCAKVAAQTMAAEEKAGRTLYVTGQGWFDGDGNRIFCWKLVIIIHLFVQAESELKEALAKYGVVRSVSINPIKRFAFVEFESQGQRELALKSALEDIGLDVRPAHVPSNKSKKTTNGKAEDILPARKNDTHCSTELIQMLTSFLQVIQSDESLSGKQELSAVVIGRQMTKLKALVEASNLQRKALVEAALAELQKHVHTCDPSLEIYGPKLRVFGSMATGFAHTYSDIDVTITGNDNSESSSKLPVLSNTDFIQKLKNKLSSNSLLKCRFVPATRCPLLKVEYAGSVSIDLTVNNLLALANTKLIRQYCLTWPVVNKLVHVLKIWALSAAVPLSSYALTLLGIRSLQTSGTIRNLQDVECVQCAAEHPIRSENEENSKKRIRRDATTPDLSDLQLTSDSWETSFCTHQSPQESSDHDTCKALTNFFHYTTNINWERDAVCVRLGKDIPKAESPCVSGTCILAIEDPFELSHNVAKRIGRFEATHLQNTFEKAQAILSGGGGIVELCDKESYLNFSKRKMNSKRKKVHKSEVKIHTVECGNASLVEVQDIITSMGVSLESVNQLNFSIPILRNTWVGTRKARRAANKKRDLQAMQGEDSKEGAMDTSIAQTQDDSSGETVPLFQLEIMTADIEKSLDTSGSRKSVTLTLTARRSNDELLQFISLFKKKLNQIKSCG